MMNKKIITLSINLFVTFSFTNLGYNSISHAQGSNPKYKIEYSVGKTYYISSDGVNLRSSNSIENRSNIVGKLTANDQVELTDALSEDTPLVQIRILKSLSFKPKQDMQYFVSRDYLSEKANEALQEYSKYFVIQNIATEKTRVYEKCEEYPGCPNRMIFETDMVVGRPEEGKGSDRDAFKTWVGHSKISEWIKFYNDGAGEYPPWYSIGQNKNTIPAPLSKSGSALLGANEWRRKNSRGETSVYGAFGWYAAKLTPSDGTNGVNYQWIHGTIGWGSDGSKAVDLTRGILINLFSNPGSHGCTRLENQAVAFLRYLLPAGTDVYRVYAHESTREEEKVKGFFNKKVTPLPRYANVYKVPGKWNWILLTDGAQKSGGLTADANTILSKNIPVSSENLLERGTYNYDQYPNAIAPNYRNMASSGKSGDRYEIDSGEDGKPTHFKGYFLVDDGQFIDYQHPDYQATNGKVRTSGLFDFRNSIPDYLRATGTHHPPEITYKDKNQY